MIGALFHKSLNVRAVPGASAGVDKIVAWGIRHKASTADIAYAVGTAQHETAGWCQPLREGCRRQGPAGTEAQAVSAVKSARAKGLIKANYIDAVNGRYYYGRGLCQITWLDNYKKFEKLTGRPLVSNPDLALDWDVALYIMYTGMQQGLFTGKKLSDYFSGTATTAQFTAARAVVNGDGRKYGAVIAEYAMIAQHHIAENRSKLEAAYLPRAGLYGLLVALCGGQT